MDWKSVGAAVAGFAPILGTILGGPLGGAAGGLIKLLANEFGLKPEEATPDALAEAIRLDPNAALKLREFELNNKVELGKLVLEQDRMYLADTADARKRQTESEKATGKRDYNLYVLAYLYVVGYFVATVVMLWLAFTNQIPSGVPDYAVFLLGNLFGGLVAGMTAVVQYFFGSSKGSYDKSANQSAEFKELMAFLKK